MNHVIDPKVYDPDLEHKVNLAFSSGKGERKTLEIASTVNPLKSQFVVTNHDKVIYRGKSFNRAIKAYNEARPVKV